MNLNDLNEASNLTASDKRKAIQQGGLTKDVAFSIKKDLAKIVKKRYNSKEWKYNTHFLDQGLQYKGDNIDKANKVIDDTIGDLYGYFVDVPMKERVRVKKSTRTVGTHEQEVYTVTPTKAEPQIEFFKFKDKPELGILFHKVR